MYEVLYRKTIFVQQPAKTNIRGHRWSQKWIFLSSEQARILFFAKNVCFKNDYTLYWGARLIYGRTLHPEPIIRALWGNMLPEALASHSWDAVNCAVLLYCTPARLHSLWTSTTFRLLWRVHSSENYTHTGSFCCPMPMFNANAVPVHPFSYLQTMLDFLLSSLLSIMPIFFSI